MLAIAAALGLAACGDSSPAPPAGERASAAAAPAAKAPPAGRCVARVGGFLKRMDTLRDRLAAGLDYNSYIEEVDAVHTAYDKLPVKKLAVGCLARSGVPGEKAFNAYIAAANVWGDCIAEPGCETSSIEARLQKKWRGASHFLSAAEGSAAQVGDQR